MIHICIDIYIYVIIYVHSSSKMSGQLLAYPALRIRCFCLRLKPETPVIFMVIPHLPGEGC